MKCCPFSQFPKRYLCFAKNEKGEALQFSVNEKVHLQLKKLAKKYPGAELRIVK